MVSRIAVTDGAGTATALGTTALEEEAAPLGGGFFLQPDIASRLKITALSVHNRRHLYIGAMVY